MMTEITGKDLSEKLRWHGRTFFDQVRCAEFFDWTCAGFSFEFTGTRADAMICAIPGVVQAMKPGTVPLIMEPVNVPDYPWIGVFIDNHEQPEFTFQLQKERQHVTLYLSDRAETHTIHVVKLSEAQFSLAALMKLSSDGSIQKDEDKTQGGIEFIGDSITCGFGNMTDDTGRAFHNHEENGWLSYGAVAARLLKLEPSMISFSGIGVVQQDGFGAYGMEDLYEYTDRVGQDVLAGRILAPAIPGQAASDISEPSPERWEFQKHPKDYVVLNLGTNDATFIQFNNGAYSEENFMNAYGRLIRKIRELNGPQTKMICALGSIDYYLFPEIEQAVARYRHESGDQKISTFRFSKMIMQGRDVGGCGHPSHWKHEIMGQEFAEYIRSIEQ